MPCAVVVTDRFVAIAQRAASGFGLPRARKIVVAHPIGGRPDSEIILLGRSALDAALACLTSSA
ncbi:MAG: hypothetical protein VX246_02675 [Myxococcota bacterium]|nr:hypothetical protein [Myxococcota bacterium]